MLKKVMAMLASKYLAIKVRIRAIETRLMIQSLLLRDKKMIRHLFRQRKCYNLSNKVKDEDEDRHLEDDDEDCYSESVVASIHNSNASTTLINNSVATTSASSPASIVEVAEEAEGEMQAEDDEEYPDPKHSLFEDNREENQSVSVIEMAKNAKEGRGKKFVLEDDIDKVADLFIQRFHHQIRLQRLHSDVEKERNSD